MVAFRTLDYIVGRPRQDGGELKWEVLEREGERDCGEGVNARAELRRRPGPV